jgi:Mn2+/Fe2+ NRAMP family transporter
MIVMMLVVSSHSAMGRFAARPLLKTFGWLATIVMAAATAAMFMSMALPNH